MLNHISEQNWEVILGRETLLSTMRSLLRVAAPSILAATLSIPLAFAENAPSEQAEYAAKSQMIKTLIEMITWPEDMDGKDINICIPNNFSHADAMTRLNGQTAKAHTLRVKRIEDPLSPNTSCQMIYLVDTSEDLQNRVIRKYKNEPVVLLGDMDRFALHGGSMNFTQLNNVLAITVNTDAMRDSNLPINLKGVEQITVIPEVDDLRSAN